MTHLGHLPSEVIGLILAKIDDLNDFRECSFVNKHFHDTMNPKLWHSPTLMNTEEHTDRLPLSQVLRCINLSKDPKALGSHIRKLRVREMDGADDLLELLHYAPLIEELVIEEYAVDDEDLQQIARLSPHLRCLYLRQLEVTDEAMKTIGRYCRQLSEVTFVSCDALTHNTLWALKNCPLERLDFIICEGFLSAPTAERLALFDGLTSLRIHHHFIGITRHFIKRLLPLKPDGSVPLAKLVELNVSSEEPLLDDSVMVPFIQAHPLLEVLCLDTCQLGKATLTAIARCLPLLRRLEIYQKDGLSSRGLREIIVRCPRLTVVELYQGGYLPVPCFPEISEQARRLGVLENDDLELIRRNSDWTVLDNDDVLFNLSNLQIFHDHFIYDTEDEMEYYYDHEDELDVEEDGYEHRFEDIDHDYHNGNEPNFEDYDFDGIGDEDDGIGSQDKELDVSSQQDEERVNE